MATEDVNVKIKLSADTKKAVGATKKVGNEAKKAQGGFSKMGAAASKAFGPIGIAAGVVTGALVGLGAAALKLVDIYSVQEQAEIRTAQTLKATGYAAGITASEIFKMASSLQEVTTFGDEAIIGGQNLLLTFKKIGGDVFPRATEVMLDMSQAMGTGLKESAIQLGKALNDPTVGLSALSRVGITFNGQQREMIKSMQKSGNIAGAQAIILKELESQFGGVARAAAQGTGKLEQSSNLIGDVFEELGKKALPTIIKIASGVDKITKGILEWLQGDETLADAASNSVNALVDLDKQIETLKKNHGNDKTLLGLKIGTVDNNDEIKELEAERVQLAKDTSRLVKAAYRETEEFKIQKKREAAETEAEIEAEKQTRMDAINAAIKNAKKAEVEKDVLSTEEKTANELAALESKLEEEEFLKIEAQAKELSNKGKHAEALLLIEKKLTTGQIKLLKQKQKADEQLTKLKLQTAQNTSNLILAIAGSENKAAFAIAKGVAIAQAVVNGALAITKVQSQTGTYSPFIIPLIKANTALQVATIAATAIKGFERGGLATGGIPGRDSIPALLSPNEVIVPPETSFADIVDAGRAISGDGGGMTEVIIGFTDNAFEIIEEKILERRAIGVGAL